MSVASRVERGLHLVAGGGTRAAWQGRGDTSLPDPAPASALVEGEAILSELFAASPRDAGWTGFVLAQLGSARPLLWVQERMAILEGGRVHAAGLGSHGAALIHVEARDAKAALWAMEEGLRCSALSGVVGELWGDPAALDFTATRRLAVAAERAGLPCWLVRLQGRPNLSGARERWRLESAPSAPHAFDPRAPGAPRWQGQLFRSRRRPAGSWLFEHGPVPLAVAERHDDAAHLLPVARRLRDRALGAA